MESRQTLSVCAVVSVLTISLGLPERVHAKSPLREGVTSGATVSAKLAGLNHRDPLFQHVSYPIAWTAAQKSSRPLLLYVTMPGCPYCVKMVKNTLKSEEIQSLVADSFETVYVDRYAQADLAAKLSVRYYPTTILVSTDNHVLDVIEGYVESRAFRRRLQTNLTAFQLKQAGDKR
jgi:hypothetical protein